MRRIAGVLWIGILAAMQGCASVHQQVLPAVDAPVEPDSRFTTFQEYVRACDSQRTAVSAPLQSPAAGTGGTRLVACLRRLDEIDVEINRQYVKELAKTLRAQGISVPADIGSQPGVQRPLTYNDLIQIDLVTRALVYGPDGKALMARTIPENTYGELLVTVTRFCPSDYGAYMAAMQFFGGRPADVQGEASYKLKGPARKAHDAYLRRYTTEGRAFNLTSLAFFADDSFLSEWGSLYFEAMTDKDRKQLVAPTLAALARSAAAVKALDQSQQMQDKLDVFITIATSPETVRYYGG